jgi:hypothetical protein
VDPRCLPNLRIIAGLPQPFTAKQAADAGIKGGDTCYKYLRWGWLAKDGSAFSLSAKFPRLEAVSPTGLTSPTRPTRPTSPFETPAKATRAELQSSLADALKGRDHALAQGRETIVEMYQQQIDKLEKQIGS